MAQVRLYLNLTPQLVLNSCFGELRLEQNLCAANDQIIYTHRNRITKSLCRVFQQKQSDKQHAGIDAVISQCLCAGANLERDDVMALLLSCQVHIAKLSSSQRFANIEIRQLPALHTASSLALIRAGCGLCCRVGGGICGRLCLERLCARGRRVPAVF